MRTFLPVSKGSERSKPQTNICIPKWFDIELGGIVANSFNQHVLKVFLKQSKSATFQQPCKSRPFGILSTISNQLSIL